MPTLPLPVPCPFTCYWDGSSTSGENLGVFSCQRDTVVTIRPIASCTVVGDTPVATADLRSFVLKNADVVFVCSLPLYCDGDGSYINGLIQVLGGRSNQ